MIHTKVTSRVTSVEASSFAILLYGCAVASNMKFCLNSVGIRTVRGRESYVLDRDGATVRTRNIQSEECNGAERPNALTFV